MRERLGLGTAAVVLAGLVAIAPLLLGPSSLQLVGTLLIVAGVLEGLHSFRVSERARRAAYASAALTVLMGLLVLGAPLLVGTALTLLLAGSFLVDGVQRAGDLWRRGENSARPPLVLGVLGNAGAAVLLLILWTTSVTWTAALAGALRIFGAGWNMVTTPVHTAEQAGSEVIRSLGLPEQPELLRLGERLTREAMERRPYDRAWVLAFAATLFAIHVGRMQAEWTLIGLLGPVVAVVGDLASALVIGFGVVGPARLAFRQLTRPLESRCWMRVVGPRDSSASPRWLDRWVDRLLRSWLTRRLRIWIRLRQMRYSLPFSIERGLQMGLPIVAVAVATVPIWGMSWYFNSENWAAAIYNSWAEQRTDTWRSAMVRAVRATTPGTDPARAFTLAPPGLAGDFASW